ncbi:putative uncharacterized protein [Clostridium sp. CAG:389]|nr:putative uncharacterized protein [Clostridium sp. CAG:389]
MYNIDEIMDMLDCNNSVETQEKGIELAKNVKCINVFILPEHLECSKNVWENCAKILANRTDKELQPYLIDILLWIEDMNWPGAIIIDDRLKKFHDMKMLSFAIKECVKRASETDNHIWLENLSELMDDNAKLK